MRSKGDLSSVKRSDPSAKCRALERRTADADAGLDFRDPDVRSAGLRSCEAAELMNREPPDKMPYGFRKTFDPGRAPRRRRRRPRQASPGARRGAREPGRAPPRRTGALPRHHRLRRHGRPADRQRHPVAPQFHPARPARPGEEPHPARPHRPARRRDCRRAGLRDPRRPAGAALRRLPGARHGGKATPCRSAGCRATSATSRSSPRPTSPSPT